jgi:hypothetical protein
MVEYGIAAGSAAGHVGGFGASGGLVRLATLGSSPTGLVVALSVAVLLLWFLR